MEVVDPIQTLLSFCCLNTSINSSCPIRALKALIHLSLTYQSCAQESISGDLLTTSLEFVQSEPFISTTPPLLPNIGQVNDTTNELVVALAHSCSKQHLVSLRLFCFSQDNLPYALQVWSCVFSIECRYIARITLPNSNL